MQDLEEKINKITKEIQNETDEQNKKKLEEDKDFLITIKDSFKAKDEEIKAKDNKYEASIKTKDEEIKAKDDIISKNSGHLKCAFKESEFKELDNPFCDKVEGKNSALLSFCQTGKRIISEGDVTTFFNNLINDVLLLCGLGEQLRIQSEFSITSFRVDILIITHRGIPKGVIQLKRPCEEFSEESYGQLFDYMFLLQHVHGVSNIFGIISCYFKTRIAWLDGNKLVETEKVEELSPISIPKLNSPFVQQIQVPIKLFLGDHPKKDRVSHQLDQIKEIKRFLFVSPEITHIDRTSNDESKLVESLCSVVKKMYYSNINQSLQLKNTFMEFTRNSFKWVELNKISFTDLGSGVEGKAWLAINTQAKAFVIKFFGANKQNLEEESKRWYDIWRIKTLVLEFNNERCLLMPFFKPITSVDYNKDGFKDRLMDACNQFSNSGYLHSDLSLRHVGKYKYNDEDKFIFFDLGLVEIIKQDAANKMFKNVTDNIEIKKKKKKFKF
ncbi:hypothetical protein DDB_G0282827 [Dictyostelium discoideum AX4]|uniref:DUF5898 domain-containing protein n=1 Tax=Dictyostelium discoideum TaxID=44689 RepID=Q54RZ1_DICDI|nr:hypothetical protein DDB_G0282827 [Dictyostelium discoideum AX4]EAL65993.1 hypothetical protein DDB_G0282827 [Dictyostelium discoideum AX4]|eukprot:XP_639346.1 hypothetical protein DDB_G0282827 [Dictyostelium discoideum AX4]